jgi:stage V sporulation protein G
VQVTEVRIKLMEQSEDRLRAFCSITLDHAFVIRDLKIIDGSSGPFVAMPSRKLSGHCPRCGYKNHLRAAYCNQCGVKLRVPSAIDSPQKLYADVAHPINSECREMISSAVLTEFEAELKRASEPGYRPRYDDEFEAISESDDEHFTRIDLKGEPLGKGDGDESAVQAGEKPALSQPAPAPHIPSIQKPATTARMSAPESESTGGFGAGIFE